MPIMLLTVDTARLLTHLSQFFQSVSTALAEVLDVSLFHGHHKWADANRLFFGGEGMIATNDRAEHRKIIKYNHLVANCLIFFNAFRMTPGATYAATRWP